MEPWCGPCFDHVLVDGRSEARRHPDVSVFDGTPGDAVPAVGVFAARLHHAGNQNVVVLACGDAGTVPVDQRFLQANAQCASVLGCGISNPCSLSAKHYLWGTHE